MIILLALLIAPTSAEPSFAFVKCETTNQHIAIQPKDDHYVVHFHCRIRNAINKPIVARVRCSQGTVEHVVSAKMTPASNNDLWSVYLRVPKYSDANSQNAATYQIELGDEDSSRVDPLLVSTSFGFRINRNQASETVADRNQNGDPYGMPIAVRRAQLEGGVIRIVAETRRGSTPYSSLDFGITSSLANEQFDGDRSAKRIIN